MHTADDASRRLADAIDVARTACQRILQLYRQLQDGVPPAQLLLARKADDSLLTRADVAAHEAICSGLGQCRADLPIVSEEGDNPFAGTTAAEYWLVDPLDGTQEFMAGTGEFTVNIALVRDGRACLGVVLAPALELGDWGGIGLGAFRQTGDQVEPIRVAAAPPPGRPQRVIASRSHMNADTAAFIESLGPHELVQAGSSLKFCRIAEGSADVYPRLGPTCEWDTAAAQAVVEAAGGHVWTLDGAPLRYGKPGLRNPHFVVSSAPAAQVLGGGAGGGAPSPRPSPAGRG